MLGDEIQLGQLVLNLVRNALDAVKSNAEANRHLALAMTCPNQTSVVLEITDNGPGIGADARGKIFDPFFTTRPQGLGMGLPISKTIADTHGASLTLCDASDGVAGTTFRVSFPAICH